MAVLDAEPPVLMQAVCKSDLIAVQDLLDGYVPDAVDTDLDILFVCPA